MLRKFHKNQITGCALMVVTIALASCNLPASSTPPSQSQAPISQPALPQTPESEPAGPAGPLEGINWSLVAYLDQEGAIASPLPGREVTARFMDGQVSGNTGCNNYFGSYQVEGSSLVVSQVGATKIACEPELLAQESTYLALLQSAAKYQSTGDQLQISDAAGQIVLTFEKVQPISLTNTAWLMISYNNGKGGLVSALSGSEITAIFAEDGSLSGFAGCNDYNTTYQIDGSAIQIQPAVTTRKACAEPEGVMQQEGDYLAALASSVSYAIQGQKLDFFGADGARAVNYAQKPPASAAGGTLDEDTLKNLGYLSGSTASGLVQLSNGEYRQVSAPGAASETVVRFDRAVSGELSEGEPAAAVILTTQTGGSGTFYELALVLLQDGQPVNVATTLLGDRVQINTITFEDGEVIVDMLNQGPTDPMCCPTQHVLQRFALQGDQLVPGSSETSQAAAEGSLPALAVGDVKVDAQGLAQNVEVKVVPAVAYDTTQDPGLTGAPQHLAVSFDGQEVMRIYPVQEYQALWEAAGDPTITNNVVAMQDLLTARKEQPPTPEAPLPMLPPQRAYNDLAAQFSYIDFASGSGVRFVGRTTQDPSPVTNQQLNYYFQGLTSDGQYYVTFALPITAQDLPQALEQVPPADLQLAGVDFPAYLQQVGQVLQSLRPSGFTPALDKLDAFVQSITIGH